MSKSLSLGFNKTDPLRQEVSSADETGRFDTPTLQPSKSEPKPPSFPRLLQGFTQNHRFPHKP